MIVVTFCYRKDDPNCARVLDQLKEIQSVVPHQLVLLDVDSDEINKTYTGGVPFVQAGPYQLQGSFTQQELLVALGAARDREQRLKGDKGYQKRIEKSRTISGSDRLSLWLSHHYMLIFNTFMALYIGVPFLAPVFMKLGLTTPAKVIYAIYTPLCHQMAYRSFFLFGEQAYYPRALANIPDVKTYEEVSGLDAFDTLAARYFLGDELLGYKIAICERDVAIYGSLLLFGVAFSIFGRKWRSIQWYWWVIFGLIPMGFDGGSQLIGFLMGSLPAWFPLQAIPAWSVRESSPFLRVLTGSLFGLATGWYLYPYVEESMVETKTAINKKIAIVRKLSEQVKPEQEVDAV
jgi:uncharacterized membrane protein